MATNYTTKTAALKATLADIRQVAVGKKIEVGSGETTTQITKDSVSAEDLLISVDGKDERQSVKTLIQQAQEDAAAAAGIQIGGVVAGTDTLTSGSDVDGDGTADIATGGITKAKGMNFRGDVTVVNNEDGTVDLWFMKAVNPGEVSNGTGYTNGSPMYIASDATDPAAWTLDGTGTSAGSKYSYCSTPSTETFTLKHASGGTTMHATNKTTQLKAEVFLAGSTTATTTVTTPAICEESTTSKARNGSFSATSGGITITVSNVIDNNSTEDAPNGHTPGFVRYSATVKVAEGTVVPNGGVYQVKVYRRINETASWSQVAATEKIYIYKSDTMTASDAPTASLTYAKDATKDKKLSGVSYTTSATVTLSGKVINTNRGGANAVAPTARAWRSDSSGAAVSFTGASNQSNQSNGTNNSTTIKAKTLTTSGSVHTDEAEYTFTESATCSASAPTKAKITDLKIYPVQQNGKMQNAAAKTVTLAEQSDWVYTSINTANSGNGTKTIIVKFHDEADRKLETLETVQAGTKATFSPTAYSSDVLLTADGYTKQALVQGGSLKYPTSDVTGTYTSASGSKFYVLPIAFDSSATQYSYLNVTVSGWGSSYNNENVRMYLVCHKNDGTSATQCLNWFKNASGCPNGATPCAENSTLSGGSWRCEINGAVFQLNGSAATDAKAGKYYLVVEMVNKNTEVGQITLSV